MTAKKHEVNIDLHYSNYSTDGEGFVEGQRFISVGIEHHNAGSGSPCDSRKEAIQSIKSYMDSRGLWSKKITLKDDTDLNITIGEIKGQSLLSWIN